METMEKPVVTREVLVMDASLLPDFSEPKAYSIIYTNDIPSLTWFVNSAMQEGHRPQGGAGAVLEDDGSVVYFQAMTHTKTSAERQGGDDR